MKKILTALLALATLCGVQVQAENEKPGRDGKHKPKCEEIRETKRENHVAKRKHHKQQRQENRAFRESLADQDPGTRFDAIIAHREEQHGENVAFHKERYNNMVAAIESCDDIPEDHKAEILDRLDAHHAEAIEFHKGIHEEVLNFLEELKNSDLTPEEKKEAWQEFHEEIREAVEDWREEHRPEGKGHGNRQGRKGKGPRADQD